MHSSTEINYNCCFLKGKILVCKSSRLTKIFRYLKTSSDWWQVVKGLEMAWNFVTSLEQWMGSRHTCKTQKQWGYLF